MEEQCTLFHKRAFLFPPHKGKLPSAGGKKGQPSDEGRPTTGQFPALSPGESALRAGPGVAAWAATVRVQRSNSGRGGEEEEEPKGRGRKREEAAEGGTERCTRQLVTARMGPTAHPSLLSTISKA